MMPYNQKNKLASFCFAGLAVCLPCAFAADGARTEPASSNVRAASVVRADARTGRLVRTTVLVQPDAAQAEKTATEAGPRSQQIAKLREMVDREVESASAKYGVDPKLVHTVIRVESNYNPIAVSNKGAQGLMQLIPSTARRMGAENSFNVRDNIEAGVRYLRLLLDRFGDDRLALAAYNAGEGAVMRYGGVPPYAETQQYVAKAGALLRNARQNAKPEQTLAKAEAAPAEPQGPPPPRPIEIYLDAEGRICIRTR